MRALTLWRPWPTAILRDEDRKPIENRPQRPPQTIRGQWLALHAGQKYAGCFRGAPAETDSPTGIVGFVRIIGYVLAAGTGYNVVRWPATGRPMVEAATDAEIHLFDRWFSGPYGWLIDENVVRLESPVPCSGKQWIWRVPEDVVVRVHEVLRDQVGGLRADRICYGDGR